MLLRPRHPHISKQLLSQRNWVFGQSNTLAGAGTIFLVTTAISSWVWDTPDYIIIFANDHSFRSLGLPRSCGELHDQALAGPVRFIAAVHGVTLPGGHLEALLGEEFGDLIADDLW